MTVQAPTQVYKCALHGEFEVKVPFNEDVPATMKCPALFHLRIRKGGKRYRVCGKPSPHILYPPAIRVIGGTTPSR